MTIFSAEAFLDGQILLFDKPLYWTSFDLVKKAKNIIRKRFGITKIKVGHTGTLDPLATGLMIICTGKSTKKINGLQGLAKEYVTTLILGKTTPSYDLETEFDKIYPANHITIELVSRAITEFTGEQLQVPPLYSAKNINGKRAYEYARKGIKMELEPGLITIHEIELLYFELPVVRLRLVCSKGTYIRSFARDFGKFLESGAHLSDLKRTKIGDYDLASATTIENFQLMLEQA